MEEPFFVAALLIKRVFERYHVAFPYGSNDRKEFWEEVDGFGTVGKFLGGEFSKNHMRRNEMNEDGSPVRSVLPMALIVR